MMTLYITDERSGARLTGYLKYLYPDRSAFGQVTIPATGSGAQIDANDLYNAEFIEVGSPGYYSFVTSTNALLQENEVALYKKPSPVKYIIGGAIAFFVLSRLSK